MREFKFRAWIKDIKRMADIESLYFPLGSPSGKDMTITIDGDCSWYSIDEVELHQYTGLKDSNGNEIYEYDVLRIYENDEYVPNRDSGGGIIDYDRIDGFSQIGVVGYHSAWFAYETKKHLKGRQEKIYAPIDCLENLEVIGNIHQNPELIKQ